MIMMNNQCHSMPLKIHVMKTKLFFFFFVFIF